MRKTNTKIRKSLTSQFNRHNNRPIGNFTINFVNNYVNNPPLKYLKTVSKKNIPNRKNNITQDCIPSLLNSDVKRLRFNLNDSNNVSFAISNINNSV